MADETPIADPLTPEDEAALITTTPPRALLRVLQAQDGIAPKVFAGFRATADSLKLPAVRTRLQHESASSAELREALREAWREGHSELLAAVTQLKPAEIPPELPGLVRRWGPQRVLLALRLDPREEVRGMPLPEPGDAPLPTPPPTPAPRPPKPPDEATRLREQAHALREDLSLARKELARTRTHAEHAERSAERWESATRAALGEVSDLRHALERSTRQLEREQKARAELDTRFREESRAHRQAAAALDALCRHAEEERRARAAHEASHPPADAWLAAARSLVGTGQAQAAIAFLAPILKDHPDADAVREVLAEAYQAAGAPAMAVTDLCALARRRLAAGRIAEAVGFACRALAVSTDDPAARLCLKDVALAAAGRELPRSLVRRLETLTRRSPELRAIAAPLLPAPPSPARQGDLTVDLPVEWPAREGTFTASLRDLFAAMDAGRVGEVERARDGLKRLRRSDPERHAAILKAIRGADDSYRIPLVRGTSPVVVDGSNVAWEAPDDRGRPRLANILSMRHELRSLGYFPIRIHVDAALVHQVDRRADLEALVARGEIRMADAGRDADEQILEDARDLGCPIITNDRMSENDPDGLVPKIRFEIGLEGAAICNMRQLLGW